MIWGRSARLDPTWSNTPQQLDPAKCLAARKISTQKMSFLGLVLHVSNTHTHAYMNIYIYNYIYICVFFLVGINIYIYIYIQFHISNSWFKDIKNKISSTVICFFFPLPPVEALSRWVPDLGARRLFIPQHGDIMATGISTHVYIYNQHNVTNLIWGYHYIILNQLNMVTYIISNHIQAT